MSSATAFEPQTFQNDAFQIGQVTSGARPLPDPYARFPHGVPRSSVHAVRSSGLSADEVNLAMDAGS